MSMYSSSKDFLILGLSHRQTTSRSLTLSHPALNHHLDCQLAQMANPPSHQPSLSLSYPTIPPQLIAVLMAECRVQATTPNVIVLRAHCF